MENRIVSKFNYEFALLIIIGGLAVSFFAQTFTYPGTIAGLFPRIVSTIVILMVLFLLVAKFRSKSAASESDEELLDDEEVGTWGKSVSKHALPVMNWKISVLLMLGYFVLIYLIGFGIGTFLYAVAIPLLLQYKNKLVAVVFALVTAVALIVLFGTLFYVPLPQGLIFELLFGG